MYKIYKDTASITVPLSIITNLLCTNFIPDKKIRLAARIPLV